MNQQLFFLGWGQPFCYFILGKKVAHHECDGLFWPQVYAFCNSWPACPHDAIFHTQDDVVERPLRFFVHANSVYPSLARLAATALRHLVNLKGSAKRKGNTPTATNKIGRAVSRARPPGFLRTPAL
jgi:hypothetical protein